MKDSRMTGGGAAPSGSRPLATNLHQVEKRPHEEKHSRVGVSKLSSSSSKSTAHLMSRLSSYVERPKFCPDRRWLAAAGEENQEATYQRHRETNVEREVYPSPTIIPFSPFPAVGLEVEHHDDSLTPVVPLILVDQLVEDAQGTDAEINAKIAKDAAATVVATLENEGSIDMQLLINILSNPQMVKKLMNGVHPWVEGEGETSNPARSEPGGMQQQIEPLIPSTLRSADIMSVFGPITAKQPVERLIQDYGARDAYMINPHVAPINLSTSRLVLHTAEAARVRPHAVPMIVLASTLPNVEELYIGPCSSMLPPTPIPPAFPTSYIPSPHYCPPAYIMDSNHHRSAIEPHGKKYVTKEQNLPIFGQYGHHIQGFRSAHNNPTSEITNLKSQEPCIYFNTSKGCRNGSKCRFKHT